MLKSSRGICFFEDEGVKEFFSKSQETSIYKKIYSKKFSNCNLSYTVFSRQKISRFETSGFLVSSFPFSNIFACSVIPITRSKYFISGELFSLNLGKFFF